MSGTEFDRKAAVVATAWEAFDGDERWEAVIKRYDLGFPYAWLVYTKAGTLGSDGEKQVEEAYDFLLKALSLEDNDDWYSWWQVIEAYNKEA